VTSRLSPELVAQAKRRSEGRCEYCHAPQVLIGQAFHIDHIIPLSLGGGTISENLCYACSHCNIAKGSRTMARDPSTQRLMRIFNPRTDAWEAHFRWSADWATLIGKTSVGRSTVVCLDVNAKILRLARPYWRIAGLIP
jgi:5-methylcytosine-specific restriction endonuclease McrA